MTTTDQARTILAEMQVIHDAALSSNARRALGKTLAALTDALDVENERMPSGNEGDDWYRIGWQDAMFNFKSRIIAALTQDTTIQEDQTND